ncbi:hypothetical protein [Hymenobacter profundi]|uniref:Uncharacterized protein n=1 Tax=Hymenobacter profundi TaxID=1982110 RepID=A0ABS6WYL5_9BACT|nr:hypothetical protein [Hymenobacter profundi]MBW3128685.1 hypothetical protein [Hymenobacter profundi]
MMQYATTRRAVGWGGIIAGLLVGLSVQQSRAQVSQVPTSGSGVMAQENINSIARGGQGYTIDTRYQGLVGSPYAIARWLPAVVTTDHDVKLQPVLLKYDVVQQLLYARQPTRTDSMLLNENRVKSFVLTDATGTVPERRFRRFVEAPEPAQGREFVEVLHEGKYTVLKQYQKKLEQASYKGAYSQDKRYDELVTKETYYLRRPDGKVVPINKLTLKALQSAAPELAAKLKSEADRNKSMGKSEADLIALLRVVDPTT